MHRVFADTGQSAGNEPKSDSCQPVWPHAQPEGALPRAILAGWTASGRHGATVTSPARTRRPEAGFPQLSARGPRPKPTTSTASSAI